MNGRMYINGNGSLFVLRKNTSILIILHIISVIFKNIIIIKLIMVINYFFYLIAAVGPPRLTSFLRAYANVSRKGKEDDYDLAQILAIKREQRRQRMK